ncbi:hypothetical protein HanIR_Chr10g0486551 [Helianthus annuus]|nr:hypothetical protein HanIR_Chr10g0486551 [Helianthus annuus]
MNLPIVHMVDAMKYTGNSMILIRLSTRFQQVVIRIQMNEQRYSPIWIYPWKMGRRTSRNTINGSDNGCVITVIHDRTLRDILKNHLKAFSELCKNNIVPRYLILDNISHVSIHPKRGPHRRAAAALRSGMFLYKS